MEASKIDQLKQSNKDLMRSFPDGGPLDMEVISKRELDGSYEEWKIIYSAESPDPDRPDALRRVSAYLLVPLNSQSGPPVPAMIAFHQCFCDCDLGKDAVVGKYPYRPDQAYGLELVYRGFVVLAPDTVSCGERRLPWVGQEGRFGDYIKRECMWLGKPDPIFREEFGYDWYGKVMLDARRAVDLLQSLPFVDSARIGAIGHSLGSGATLTSMLADERIKAGVMSPAGWEDPVQLAALAPRFLQGLQGTYDGNEQTPSKVRSVYTTAKSYYAQVGAGDNLQLRAMPCGHYFHEDFKCEAFAALREHFGMPKRAHVSIRSVLDLAMEKLEFAPRCKEVVSIRDSEDAHAEVDADDLAMAFFGTLMTLVQKTPWGSRVDVDVQSLDNGWSVSFFVPGGDDSHKQPHEYHLTRVPLILADSGARLERHTTSEGLRYLITTQKDANKNLERTRNAAPLK